MSDLVAIAYDCAPSGQEVAANIVDLQKAHQIDIEDLVVVERGFDFISRPGDDREQPPSASAC